MQNQTVRTGCSMEWASYAETLQNACVIRSGVFEGAGSQRWEDDFASEDSAALLLGLEFGSAWICVTFLGSLLRAQ